MYFFFDLDGPILDVSQKYYRVYFDLVNGQGEVPISKRDYWESKRQRMPDEKILEQSKLSHWYKEFQAIRKSKIETTQYLKFDAVWCGISEMLSILSNKYPLFLVTLRSSREMLIWQIEYLKIKSHFTAILSAPGDISPNGKASIKNNLVRRYLGLNDEQKIEGWFIGDTETDVNAGKALGTETAAVTFGIRTVEQLKQVEPNIMLMTPQDLICWLEQCNSSDA
ncbi:MAG: HAD family hydrolase [Symploca sp. SIO2B6]|nr:HAD family hydrolase [Symploca sp. SIO2B6]